MYPFFGERYLADVTNLAMKEFVDHISSLAPPNFFRPVWEDRLMTEGHVVRRGRNLGYVQCEITDDQGKLVAKAASTCLVLRGENPTGR